MRNTVFAFAALCAACLALSACVSSGSSGGAGAARTEPRYLIRARNDSGFVIAYQAHFAVDGDSIAEISSRRYEDLTLGEDSRYERIYARTYAVDVDATGSDPAAWKYTQNVYDTERYDLQLLIGDLKRMDLPYSGSLYVLVTAFDEYRVVGVAALDGNAVRGESYAMFRSGRQMDLPKGMRLDSLSSFYRHR